VSAIQLVGFDARGGSNTSVDGEIWTHGENFGDEPAAVIMPPGYRHPKGAEATSVPLGSWMLGIFLLLGGIAIYFFPATTAAGRRHRNAGAIFALNLLLGWTLIGWVVSLVWVYTKDTSPSAATSLNASTKLCPFCAEPIQPAAIRCKHCGSDLSASEVPP
jgi:hypothetical protein